MSNNQSLGFANLPNQVHRKSVKKGFDFTLLVVGEAGLGKSTLVNSLFRTDLYSGRENPRRSQLEDRVEVVSVTKDIEESGVKLRLTVVDTPGFGDGLNNENCCDPVLVHVDQQFERYLAHETSLNRRQINDQRIHCCFYFISPTGYGLKPLDIKFMLALHKKVNIIPLIAKADMLTQKEKEEMKKRILNDIKSNEISVYSMPDNDPEEDADFAEQIQALKAAMPFAVSASLETHEVRGKQVLGRAYPWGIFETENQDHCDFTKLRSLLVTHMQDLREVTQEVHYENYRAARMGSSSGPVAFSHETTIDGDYESDRKLKEKEAELKKMEMQMKQMQELLMKTQQQQAAMEQANGHNGSAV
jgi:septin 2